MKEHEVTWDQFQHSLQELETRINIQKQVANAIGTFVLFFIFASFSSSNDLLKLKSCSFWLKTTLSIIDSVSSASIPDEHEDIMEVFKKFELELTTCQILDVSTSEPAINIATGETVATVCDDSSSSALSNLKLAEEAEKENAN